jgi:long-chain acyl-CoA synthetase
MEFFNLYEALVRRAKQTPESLYLGATKLGGSSYESFHFLSWKEVLERVQNYGDFLRSRGLQRGDRVGLLGKNSIEWLLLDWAAISSGFVTVPLYLQSHPEEIQFILEESETKILFVDEKIQGILTRQILFSEIEAESQRRHASFVPTPLLPDEVCSIIYTSGTSGKPKGVMHTARNFFEAVQIANHYLKLGHKDRLFSYLPLSHVAERVLIEFGSIYFGSQVFVCDRVERAIGLLPVAKPTVFFAVPRVWETLKTRVEKELRSNSLLQERIRKIPFFLRKFVLSWFIRKKLGLNATRFCISGAAKLSVETVLALKEWGICVNEAYGLTETLCVSAINPQGKPVVGSVGKIYPGVELKIESDGEICLKAPFHFKGYYKHPELTLEVLREGWFHTGDIGEVDSRGNLKVTDRKKDLFKASNGKYIAPVAIENLLKQHPSIQEVLVIGENRPHCIAMAAVESDADESSMFKHLEKVNSKLASHEQIRTLGLLRKSWTPNSGELTPSLKVKRGAVMELYSREIKELYETPSRVRFF